VLTRAQKSDGVPRVASRWLLRLKGLLNGLGALDVLAPEQPWLAWALARTRPGTQPPLKAPEPRPALSLRPRKLSVSDVETWLANPYAIFASRILKLEPLPPLGERPDAALRGTMVHGALAALAKSHPVELPEDVLGALMRAARELLGDRAADPRIAAFWLPRFERLARWFAATEADRRVRASRQLVEIRGEFSFAAPAGPFTLTARADRIDVLPGGIAITDYKTMGKSGLQALCRRAVVLGAPQLPLEALIAAEGGFDRLGKAIPLELRYISASGAEPAGVAMSLAVEDMDALIAEARKGLERLVALYDDERTPYKAVRRAGFSYDYDDFAHLARVDEWAGAEPDAGDGT
jgi:ATP-dependent helicase/nuclease subunit B